MSTNLPLGRSFICSVERADIYFYNNGRSHADNMDFLAHVHVAPDVVFTLRVLGEVDKRDLTMFEKAAFPGLHSGAVIGTLREVSYRTDSKAFARRMGNVAKACEVTFEGSNLEGEEAEAFDRAQVQKTVGKTVVVQAENRSFQNEHSNHVNYTEVFWRALEPLDRVSEVSRDVLLSVLRKVWSICMDERKRPHQKVDDVISLIGAMQVI